MKIEKFRLDDIAVMLLKAFIEAEESAKAAWGTSDHKSKALDTTPPANEFALHMQFLQHNPQALQGRTVLRLDVESHGDDGLKTLLKKGQALRWSYSISARIARAYHKAER